MVIDCILVYLQGDSRNMSKLPHPIPYQGSKRGLAPTIARFVPGKHTRLLEPFAGSAAMTLYAAQMRLASEFVVGDSLVPIVELWRAMVQKPEDVVVRYRDVWTGQKPGDDSYFNVIRDRYNAAFDPVDLLYLICRCVKNAVRFNRHGRFTQSVDKRRLGMHPDKMEQAVKGAASILKGRVEFRSGDWIETVSDASPTDFVYLDPPYLGTSIGRDKRYHQQLAQEQIISGIEKLLSKGVPFALSYDGSTGDKEYGPPLPKHLGLTRLRLHAGISSQATLSGRKAETIESLYLSPGLAKQTAEIIRQAPVQEALNL